MARSSALRSPVLRDSRPRDSKAAAPSIAGDKPVRKIAASAAAARSSRRKTMVRDARSPKGRIIPVESGTKKAAPSTNSSSSSRRSTTAKKATSAKTRATRSQESSPEQRPSALTMDDDLNGIWVTYKKTNDYNLRNILIEIHMPLVRMIAERLLQTLPKSIELEDLTSAGTFGLMDAINGFDLSRGIKFKTYCTTRIRGSILDELRQADWLPRNVRKNLRRIEGTISALEQRLGRTPREQELAEALGVPIDEYQHMLLESRGYQLLHYEDFQESEDSDFFDVFKADNQVGPLDVLEDQRFRRALVQAISVLPEREKIVMGLYYEQEMNLKEIGQVLGVSESRVCQLHSQAVARLRSRLKSYTQKT
jgi:RNA polymerase sigma factor for flagellar operon FliA